jgi:phosphatidylglycerophosphate synthase
MTDNKKYKGEKKDEWFVLTALISRRLAYPLAVFFCKLGISANAVTIMGGLSWVLSAPAMILAGWLLGRGISSAAYWFLGTSLLLVNLGYILDVADGSVARMTGSSSSAGYFLDYVFHLVFHPMYFCSIGIFLYLISGWVGYLVIGVLSICSGWGVSFSAKEHVLCEHVAKNSIDLSNFSDDDRYRFFVDSAVTRQTVTEKRDFRKLCTALIKELLLFPGQYTTFSIVIIVDLILSRFTSADFILLKIMFMGLAVITTLRVPFRIRREYMTLAAYDEFRKRGT